MAPAVYFSSLCVYDGKWWNPEDMYSEKRVNPGVVQIISGSESYSHYSLSNPVS